MFNIKSPILTGLHKKTFKTDFKTWAIIEEILYSDIDEQDKVILVLDLSEVSTIEEFTDFLNCGYEKVNNNVEEADIERPYSYVYDWDLIYSAFLEQYNIDIIETNIHYWKFKALFNNLHDTRLNKIMEYRMIDTSQIKDRNQREFYEEMKRIYALPRITKKEDLEKIELFNSL